MAQHMATKLDSILKGKFSLNATNAPNLDEETRQQQKEEHVPNHLDASDKKELINNEDESNLEEGQFNANLSQIIMTNKIKMSLKHTTENNDNE